MTHSLITRVAPATAGGWVAIAANTRVLVVGATPDDAFVASAWQVIGESDGFKRTLDLLTSKGLSATPPFALIDWQGDALRVIVRGNVALTVTHSTATETLDGSGVSTWIERAINGVTALTLEVTGAVAAPVAALPLQSGAAWVASLALGTGDAAPVPPRLAAPADAPATAPAAIVKPAIVEPTVVEPTVVETDIEATVTDAASAVDERTIGAPTAEPATNGDDLTTSPEGYDYLFGDTMYRSVADAAVRDTADEEKAVESAAQPAAQNDENGASGDHDGHTVLTSNIAKLRGRRKPKAATAAAPTPAPVVTLVLSTGAREPLTQPILVGRSPSASQVSGGQMPRLITVGGADQDISRTHVRFVLEGDTVVVTDLHSRNGTTVALPGKEPQKLRAGEPTSVIVGTVVDLGGGITLTVDEA